MMTLLSMHKKNLTQWFIVMKIKCLQAGSLLRIRKIRKENQRNEEKLILERMVEIV